MCFFATLIQYTQRMNMSLAIVCMVNHTALDELRKINTNLNEFNSSLISQQSLSYTSEMKNLSSSHCFFKDDIKKKSLVSNYISKMR